MAGDRFETTYVPEVEEHRRREQERRVAQEGAELWRRRKEELQRQKQREQLELREILANYSPWGKPGGGAPCPATLRKKNVPLEPVEPLRNHGHGQPSWPTPWGRPGPGGVPWRDPKLLGMHFLESMGWTSDSTIDRFCRRNLDPIPSPVIGKISDSKLSADSPGNLAVESTNPFNEEVQVYKLTGGVELVPLLMSRRPHHSQSARHLITDATKPGYTIDSLRALGIGNREYIAQLTEQIRRKQDRALEERRLEWENCRRHFDTWRRLWGRPGHGAPIDHVQRSNLYNILYRPAIY